MRGKVARSPSLLFFIILPILLKKNLNFYLSILISSSVMVVFYTLYLSILKLFKISL